MKLSKLRAAHFSRHLAGTTIPRQNTTSFGMRHALKKAGHTPYAGESGEVEGKAARPRLDRPGRKAGGRVCKADGGWTGEGDSGRTKKEAVADIEANRAGPSFSGGVMGAGLGTLLGNKGIKAPLAKAAGAGLTALGTYLVGRDMNAAGRSKKLDREADEAEGHAKGGFIKMKHPGSLRKALGAKEGETIPAKKLEKAEHSDNPTLRKRAVLAETMKKWKHK